MKGGKDSSWVTSGSLQKRPIATATSFESQRKREKKKGEVGEGSALSKKEKSRKKGIMRNSVAGRNTLLPKHHKKKKSDDKEKRKEEQNMKNVRGRGGGNG